MSRDRKIWLDVAKGLALTLVVCNHIGVIPIYVQTYLQFYMPMFFISSGYVYVHRKNFTEFVRRKLKRLIIPYFHYSFFLLLFDVVLVLKGHRENNIMQAMMGVLYGANSYTARPDGEVLFVIDNSPMWFLLALFNAYVVFWIEYALVKRTERQRQSLIILFCLNFIITKLFTNLSILLPWSLDTVFMSVNFMWFGHWLNQKKRYLDNKNKFKSIITTWIAIGGGGSAYALMICINGGMNYSTREWGKCLLIYWGCGILGTLIFYWICMQLARFKWAHSLFEMCCTASIPLLCIHMFLNGCLVWIFKKINFDLGVRYPVIRALGIGCICVGGTYMINYIRKKKEIKVRKCQY